MTGKWIRAGIGALAMGAIAWATAAQASAPVIHLYEGTHETPSAAAAGLGTTSSLMWDLSTAHPEVQALARSLNADPAKAADRIYEYVRYTVETLPMHGLKKGSMGAIIDKKGTALDQAVLMAELLYAAGKTSAKVHLVELKLTLVDFDGWHGVSDAGDICRLLKAGGIPFSFDGVSGFTGNCAATSGATHVRLMHAVVELNGSYYDPAYKPQTHIDGINLGTAMGFSLSGLQSAANFTTGTTNGVPYVSGAGVPAAVETELQARAEQLVRTLRDRNAGDTAYTSTENYKLSTTDVVGGVEVTEAASVEGSNHGAGSLAALVGDHTTLSKTYGKVSNRPKVAIPDDLRTKITISHNGANFSAHLDDLYGYRLWFAKVGASTAPDITFNVGGNRVWQQAYSSGSSLSVSIDHPYSAPRTEVFNPPFSVGDHAALVLSSGDAGLGLQGRMGDAVYQGSYIDTSNTSSLANEQAIAQMSLGGAYLAQQTQLAMLVEGVTDENILTHDFVGVIAGDNATDIVPHIDVRGQISILTAGGNANKVKAVNGTLTSAMSVLEASVADQISNISTTDVKGRSAVSLIVNALTNGLFGVPEDNFASIEPSLVGYGTAVLDRLYDDTPATATGYNTTHDIVLPKYGDATVVNGTTVNPYAAVDPATGAIGFLLDDSVFSSETSIKGTFSADISAGGAISASTDSLLATVGLDPNVIPSATGAGFGNTDLVAGSGAFPYALPFRRSFSGGTSAVSGWSHNYDIDARYGANGMIALGSRKPVEATRAIAALYATFKYLEDCVAATTPCDISEQVALSAVTANWLQNALVDNVINVRNGHSFTTYAKLASGTYYAPNGEPTTVTTTSSAITITYQSGRQTLFAVDSSNNREFLIDKMTWPTGMEVDFTVTVSSGGSQTIAVSNSLGRSLTIVKQSAAAAGTFQNITVTDDQGIVATLTEQGLSTNPPVPYTKATINGVNVANYHFNGDGRIIRIRTPEYTNKVLYTYNALGQMETSDLADQGVTAFYRNDWRNETVTPGNGGGVAVTDPYGRYAVSIDSLDNQAKSTFDRLGRVVESRSPVDESGHDTYATIAYDRFHNRSSSTAYSKPDPNNGNAREALTTNFTYYGTSKYRQLATVTDPLSRVTTLDYFDSGETLASGKRGQLKSQTLPTATVDVAGTPTSVQPVTSFTYLANGLVDEITAPDGTKTKYTYTGGLPTTVTVDAGTGGLQLATTMSYHANGDLHTVKDHRTTGATTTITYDALRRQKTVSAPGISFTEFDYDGDGRLTASKLCAEALTCTGANILKQTTRTYDGAGRVLTVSDKASNSFSVAYDDANRTITVTDPRGVKERRLFDVLGRMVETTFNHQPAAGTTTIVEKVNFKQDGPLNFVEDGRETKTYYRYDHFNRVTKTDYVGGLDEEITAYDTIGRPTQLKNRAGDTIDLTYNNLDWVTQRKITRLVGGAIVTYNFTYDVMGRVKSVSHLDTSTADPVQTVSYTYDSLGRPLDEIGANGLRSGYAYNDALGKTTLYYGDRTAGGTYSVEYLTDALGRLDKIQEDASNLIADYGYDAEGRVDQIDFGNGTKQTLTYETDTGWLNTLSLDASGTADDVTFTYTRDDEGRITNEHISNDAYTFKNHQVMAESISYQANTENQYTLPADILHSYDLNGNLTDDGEYTYAYDAENRLTEARKYVTASTTTLVGTYKYDALGRRTEKTVTAGAVTTRYMYAGDQVLAEYNQSNVLQRRYVYGPGIDNPIMVEEAGGTQHYLHRDGKGSIMAASASGGSVAYKFTADVYGFGADETTSPYRFTARRIDEETGNYYYRNRYYHTSTGRFMSNDPIGYSDGLNMYSYAYNDPVNFRDPMGLSGQSDDDDDGTGKIERDSPGNPPSSGNRGGSIPEIVVTGIRLTGPTDQHLLWEQFFADLKNDFNNIFAAGYVFAVDTVGSAQQKVKENACQVGNEIADVADKLGDVSLRVTAAGLTLTAAGIVTGQPEIAAPGVAVTSTGGVLGTGAGVLQFIAGVFQGIGADDYRNSQAALLSFGSGVLLSKGLAATIPRGVGRIQSGYTVDKIAEAQKTNTFIGNVVGATMSLEEFLSVKMADCSAQ